MSGDVLPKDMAVVLEADEGSYTFWMTEKQGEKDEKNVLKGTDDNSQTTGGTIYYGFSNGKRGVGFYWRKADGGAFENGAHKAYIAYTPSSTAQAKSYLVLILQQEFTLRHFRNHKWRMNQPIILLDNVSEKTIKAS